MQNLKNYVTIWILYLKLFSSLFDGLFNFQFELKELNLETVWALK